jgi:hypothetical protein
VRRVVLTATTAFANHTGDLIVIIRSDSSIVTYQDVQDAERALDALAAEHAVVALLDLHGVTDTLDSTTSLGTAAAVVSYVGRHSTTRYDAQRDIADRIRAGQILLGVLVFTRGKRVKRKCRPTQETGSKAWFCSRFSTARLFVDDSSDHVESVASLRDGLQAILFDPQGDVSLPEVIEQSLLL